MGGSTVGPVYVSTDGGRTWTLNSIVPGGDMTGDITVRLRTAIERPVRRDLAPGLASTIPN
jgi:hypothetical protein